MSASSTATTATGAGLPTGLAPSLGRDELMQHVVPLAAIKV